MKRHKIFFSSILSCALIFLLTSPVRAQIEVGDFTIRGEGEFGGVLRDTNGKRQKFEEYRDLSETAIVPQLQLMIGGKKEDFYLNLGIPEIKRSPFNLKYFFLMQFA